MSAPPEKPRFSKSAADARRLELERVAALSPRERMILALELGERSRALIERMRSGPKGA